MSLFAAFAEFIRPYHTLVPHMYLNPRGQVCVGIDHVFERPDSAFGLKWRVRGTGEPATINQISTDYGRVKRAARTKQPGEYLAMTLLSLPQDELRDLFANHCEEIEERLRKYKAFQLAPLAAQIAMMDLAFAGRSTILAIEDSPLRQAIIASDWKECSAQSPRGDIGAARNKAVSELFLRAQAWKDSNLAKSREAVTVKEKRP